MVGALERLVPEQDVGRTAERQAEIAPVERDVGEADQRPSLALLRPEPVRVSLDPRQRDARLHAPAGDVRAVKLRYRSPAVACTLDGDTIALHEPVDGAAPGQTAVFLRGDAVVGCATIASPHQRA